MESGKTTGAGAPFPGLKPFDWGALALGLALTVLSAVLVYSGGGTGTRVLIRGDGGRWIFPQDAAERIPVPGPLGDTVVELGGGRVRVLSSPCGGQTCVAAGAIHAPGQVLACLPNRVFISLEGAEAGEGSSGAESGGALDALVW